MMTRPNSYIKVPLMIGAIAPARGVVTLPPIILSSLAALLVAWLSSLIFRDPQLDRPLRRIHMREGSNLGKLLNISQIW